MAQNLNPEENSKPIGYVVGGSLMENLNVRLTIPAEKVQEGSFVVIESGDHLFYGLVVDIQLGATDPRFADEQSEMRLPAELAALLHGQTLYTNLEVMPNLMLERGPALESPEYPAWADQHKDNPPRPTPIKTVPAHHASARPAQAGDVAEIFGKPEEPGQFIIGNTREQGLPVCLNLDKFVQRSSGIFGATGSGKSFLARLMLAGLIHYDKSSVLVFDMHNEYGLDDLNSDTGGSTIGLRTKFPAKVRIVGLGRNTTIRGKTPDFHLELGYRDIQPEDIELLTRELNLKETTSTTLDALFTSFGAAHWFEAFKEMKNGAMIETEDGKRIPSPESVAAWANNCGVNVMAAEGLHSKLSRVFTKPYIVGQPASDTVKEIIKALQAGQHIVLSFGDYENDLDYLLVSNLLTRRIREAWVETTNQARGKDQNAKVRPLVIVLEEAHKLLNREMAGQTTFSQIARELRKYFVTLLVIDQRPSQIYDEVMSQLGTRISGWLGDDADIQAVLSGLAGRDALRGMLSHLQPKEEVLLLGWGVPMPIPVRSRRYDPQFWVDLLGVSSMRDEKTISKELGFD